jgi:hypothetical protein
MNMDQEKSISQSKNQSEDVSVSLPAEKNQQVIYHATKQHRDWLNAWTILVLPSLFWCFAVFFSLILDGVFNDFFIENDLEEKIGSIIAFFFVAFPFICLIWSGCCFFGKNRMIVHVGYVQIIVNILLSLMYPFVVFASCVLPIMSWFTPV